MNRFRQLGCVGCVLAFLGLCKVAFVSGVCAPCNVLKIAWGSTAKFFDVSKLVRCKIG